MLNRLITGLFIMGCCYSSLAQKKSIAMYHETYRPQFHFSPKSHWMNDPNGMVYVNGVYHLFFQYNPSASVPGNIHWGHAVSTDLLHWQEKPIALYPDSLGLIFSGSAVFDKNNTSGLGTPGHPPIVALYASHSLENEKAGRTDVETQSLAYSTDEGNTWHKYAHNPVIKNMGDRDFRDPKVTWYEPQQKWVMALAAHDHIDFYSSKNLINWVKESAFGQQLGAHGGTWECPDLFEVPYGGNKFWVLIVNVNPGGPNRGSATQYFMGDFDGKEFKPVDNITRWMNFGPDNYAGVTWSNTGKRKIFLGWMSNWLYGDKVPTSPWRSSMAIPVDLGVKKVNEQYFVTSEPVKELKSIALPSHSWKNLKIQGIYRLNQQLNSANGKFILKLSDVEVADFSIRIANKKGEVLKIGYDKQNNNYYVDRSETGNIHFSKDYSLVSTAPRISKSDKLNITIVADAASAEVFADDGLTNLTSLFFSTQPLTQVSVNAASPLAVGSMSYAGLGSVWHK